MILNGFKPYKMGINAFKCFIYDFFMIFDLFNDLKCFKMLLNAVKCFYMLCNAFKCVQGFQPTSTNLKINFSIAAKIRHHKQADKTKEKVQKTRQQYRHRLRAHAEEK